MFKSLHGMRARIEEAEKTQVYKDSRRMSNFGMAVVLGGQLIRVARTNTGYVFPQIARHHLSNLADTWTIAAMLDYTQLAVSAAFNKKAVSRPISCATAAFVAGTLWEVYTAQLPNRKFDWADESLYGASSIAYILTKKYRQNNLQKQTPAP